MFPLMVSLFVQGLDIYFRFCCHCVLTGAFAPSLEVAMYLWSFWAWALYDCLFRFVNGVGAFVRAFFVRFAFSQTFFKGVFLTASGLTDATGVSVLLPMSFVSMTVSSLLVAVVHFYNGFRSHCFTVGTKLLIVSLFV